MLRVLLHCPDELRGRPEAHGLELDRGLGLEATSVHGPPSPKASASAGALGRGKRCAAAPAGSHLAQASPCKGLRPRAGRKMAASLSELGNNILDTQAQ